MTAIVLNDVELAQLRDFAEQNHLSADEVKRIIVGDALCPGDRDGYTIHIPPCWKIVYSIGFYPRLVRHMSMSLLSTLRHAGRVPNLTVVRLVCESLGFRNFEESEISCTDGIVEVMELVDPIDNNTIK